MLTDITADEAHEIVVDSNYVQRVLTPSEKARSISQKYALAGRKKRSKTASANPSTSRSARSTIFRGGRSRAMCGWAAWTKSLLALLDGGKLPLTTALRLVDFAPKASGIWPPATPTSWQVPKWPS